MEPHQIPEIMRMNLDSVILRMKQFKVADVVHFNYLTKPKFDNIEESIHTL